MDRAAIFTEITRQNALRRESGLPLWNVREQFEHRVAQIESRKYMEYRRTFKSLYERIEREVLDKRGFKDRDIKSLGSFARMGIGHETALIFEAELARMGIQKPKYSGKNTISYGDKK